MENIEALRKLREQFAQLPQVGAKTAQRYAYHVLTMEPEAVKEFAQDMYRARLSVHPCPVCGALTDRERCDICADEGRNGRQLCVVRDSRDVWALERVREFHGVYHVLGGTIRPEYGVGPKDIRIKELIDRVNAGGIDEVILATNPDVHGEATAVYISRLLAPTGVKVTRIAHGVPVGGELEYTDEITLLKALEGRTAY